MKGFLVLLDSNMCEVRRISLLKLPLKREYIQRRSEDMYAESDPCIIYETAIVRRFGLELLDELEERSDVGTIFDISDIDCILKKAVSLPDVAAFGRFE